MPAQIAQGIGLNIRIIEQNLASLVVIKPGMRFASVDLPLPERPTSAIICPGSAVKLTESSTRLSVPG